MHYEDLYVRFLGDEYDQADDTGAKRKLIICTTPRTGGHTCCQHLKQLGLGIPTEYMQPRYAVPLMRRWSNMPGLERDELMRLAPRYGEHLLRYRSRNGVFAAKIFPDNLPFTRDAFGEDDDSWLYLRLFRRNKVEQTISLLSVIYTGRPFDSEKQLIDSGLIGHIGPKAVRDAVKFLHDNETFWAETLAGVPAERQAALAYEDLVADPSPAVQAAVAGWFANPPFSGEPAAIQGRYSIDRDLKDQIAERYADDIAQLWSELPPTGFETLSTVAP